MICKEANEGTCRKKNPYEKEHDLAREEFTAKYGMFGEKLKTEEEIAREKREHTHRLYTMRMLRNMRRYRKSGWRPRENCVSTGTGA